MGAIGQSLSRHPILTALGAGIAFPVLLPLILFAAPLLFGLAAAWFLWRLVCQRGGGQLAQTYQQSPLERIIPLSYPAQPRSEGSSPPSSPDTAGRFRHVSLHLLDRWLQAVGGRVICYQPLTSKLQHLTLLCLCTLHIAFVS